MPRINQQIRSDVPMIYPDGLEEDCGAVKRRKTKGNRRRKKKELAEINWTWQGVPGSECRTGGWMVGSAIRLLIIFLTYPFFGLKTAKNVSKDLYIIVLGAAYAFHMKKLTTRRIMGQTCQFE
jgi:hypothetical protein